MANYVKDIFKFLKFFKANETDYCGRPNAWGDCNRMNGLLLRILDEWREEAKAPCLIHAGYETNGHVNHSEHGYGNAVDCHFKGITLWQAYSALQTVLKRYNLVNRVAIGVYFWWNSPGFHLDLRGFELTWYCEKQNQYVYDKAGAEKLMKAKAGIK